MRRRVFLGLGAAAAGAAVWFIPSGGYGGVAIDAAAAHAAVLGGSLTLIDIRRPDEWALTGIGQGAHPLDMRSADFNDALARLLDGNRSAPVALICARGVRSARQATRLTQAGFSQVIDVPEGMLGSAAGPGWIARGLPVRPV